MTVFPFNIITLKKKKKTFNIEHINTEEKFNIICKITGKLLFTFRRVPAHENKIN
jgi:hypothetical protein